MGFKDSLLDTYFNVVLFHNQGSNGSMTAVIYHLLRSSCALGPELHTGTQGCLSLGSPCPNDYTYSFILHIVT